MVPSFLASYATVIINTDLSHSAALLVFVLCMPYGLESLPDSPFSPARRKGKAADHQ